MNRLKDLREDKDMNEAEVGKVVSLSQQQYSSIEIGVCSLDSVKLIILSKFYNTSTDYILCLTNEIRPYLRNKNHILKLSELKKSKNLVGKTIAPIVGLSQQQYSRIENGKSVISHDKLIKLAEFYNTSVDYILGLTDEIKPYPKPKFEMKEEKN